MRTIVLAPSAWSRRRAPTRSQRGTSALLPAGRRSPPRQWLGPQPRRIYVELRSHGAGDVINLVPLVRELAARHPAATVFVVSNHDGLPFSSLAANVRTLPALPADERIDGDDACHLDLTPWVRYHLLCPHWLQYLLIAGVGSCTVGGDPFPLLPSGVPARLASALAEPYVLLHARNTRAEWQGRNTDPANLRHLVERVRARGYRVWAIGNDADPVDGVPHLGSLTATELMQAMRGAHGFVGIDSFPLHVAALYDRPSLAFFGATYPSVVLTPVTRLVALRNEALACNGCVYVTRPIGYNECHFGDQRCGEPLPAERLDDCAERFAALLADAQAAPVLPSTAELEAQLRAHQLAFEEAIVIDQLRDRLPLERVRDRLPMPRRLRRLLTSLREGWRTKHEPR
jgi:ADP-heptose:LPS heptosyltransferase